MTVGDFVAYAEMSFVSQYITHLRAFQLKIIANQVRSVIQLQFVVILYSCVVEIHAEIVLLYSNQ